jgi:hypothetical protein
VTALLEYGYRRFHGGRRGRGWRWAVVAAAAIRQNWRSKLVRWWALACWLPVLLGGVFFYLVGQVTASGAGGTPSPVIEQFLLGLSAADPFLLERLLQDPSTVRVALWTLAFEFMARTTQLLATLLVPALVGPGLIADDCRQGALTLYFSRPLGVVDYLVGKFVAVAFFIALVSLAPMVGLYVVSIMCAPSLAVLQETWLVGLRVVLAGLVLVVPTALLVLGLSSLTSHRGYLAFLWIGFVLGSLIISAVLRPAFEVWFDAGDSPPDYALLCSYPDNLITTASWVLDLEGAARPLAADSRSFRRALRRLSTRQPPQLAVLILSVLAGLALLVTLVTIRGRSRARG